MTNYVDKFLLETSNFKIDREDINKVIERAKVKDLNGRIFSRVEEAGNCSHGK